MLTCEPTPLDPGQKSLSEILALLGYTHKPSDRGQNWGARDILQGDQIVLKIVSANDVWNWLREKGKISC